MPSPKPGGPRPREREDQHWLHNSPPSIAYSTACPNRHSRGDFQRDLRLHQPESPGLHLTRQELHPPGSCSVLPRPWDLRWPVAPSRQILQKQCALHSRFLWCETPQQHAQRPAGFRNQTPRQRPALQWATSPTSSAHAPLGGAGREDRSVRPPSIGERRNSGSFQTEDIAPLQGIPLNPQERVAFHRSKPREEATCPHRRNPSRSSH